MSRKEYIQELLNKALAQTATPEELHELSQLVYTDIDGGATGEINAFLQSKTIKDESPAPGRANALLESILQADKPSSVKPARVISIGRRIAVAAAVVGLIALTLFTWINNRNGKDNITPTAIHKNDALPGGNRAILTLVNGDIIVLDSASNGIVAQQANTKILKTSDGQLAYSFTKNNISELLYNTLSTPRGGQYQVVLPDGTKVWLNAATTLRFPVAFAGNERIVELSGEAYFEVQKDEQRPFKVKTNNATVQVLGTHFNVMAYSDEDEIRTTLLEGSVKVSASGNTAFLIPGQQAVLKSDSSLQVIKNANTEEAIAWKNGYFQFSKIDAKAMRQISRWYDVDIVYESPIKEKEYAGQIDRTEKLSNMVEAFKVIGINSKIEQGKLIVLP